MLKVKSRHSWPVMQSTGSQERLDTQIQHALKALVAALNRLALKLTNPTAIVLSAPVFIHANNW